MKSCSVNSRRCDSLSPCLRTSLFNSVSSQGVAENEEIVAFIRVCHSVSAVIVYKLKMSTVSRSCGDSHSGNVDRYITHWSVILRLDAFGICNNLWLDQAQHLTQTRGRPCLLLSVG